MAENISEASVDSLTVRCWKASALILEIKNVIRSHEKELKTTSPSAGVVMDHSKRMGWLHPIEVSSSKKTKPVEFFLLALDARKEEPGYPQELLQAHMPAGVISYRSANDMKRIRVYHKFLLLRQNSPLI